MLYRAEPLPAMHLDAFLVVGLAPDTGLSYWRFSYFTRERLSMLSYNITRLSGCSPRWRVVADKGSIILWATERSVTTPCARWVGAGCLPSHRAELQSE